MKTNKFQNNIVNIFFVISIIICVVAIIFSLFSFVQAYSELSEEIANINGTITKDFNEILKMLSKKETNTENIIEQIDLTNTHVSSTINQLEKLQEIEYKAISHNTLTFLYTFLSSVLIGIGTYYVNQCVKYTTAINEAKKQISQNKNEVKELKETIKKQNVQTLDLSFGHHYQTIISLLDSIINVTNQGDSDMHKILCEYVPRLNIEIQNFYTFATSINAFDKQDIKEVNGKKLLFDLNNLKKRIESLPTDKSPLIINKSKENLLNKIKQIRKLFES